MHRIFRVFWQSVIFRTFYNFYTNSSQVLDQTGKEIKPFPEVPIVLDYLAERGVTIAAASRTTKPPGAHQLLDLFDWNRYFALKEIYPGCKTTHFKRH